MAGYLCSFLCIIRYSIANRIMKITAQKLDYLTGATQIVEVAHDPATKATRLFVSGFLRATRQDNQGLLDALAFLSSLEKELDSSLE